MRVAAVDLGTNTARMLIADVDGGAVTWVDRHVAVTGLGWEVDRRRAFGPDNVDRTLRILQGFGILLGVSGAERSLAVATSASRDATNRDDFFDQAEAVLGVRPELVSGEREAHLSFRGATIGRMGDERWLIIDPGGGSTEFILGGSAPEFIESCDIGSLRLTERALPLGPPSFDEMKAADDEARRAFRQLEFEHQPAKVVGVGGTFTALAAIALDLDQYDPELVEGTELSLQRLDGLIIELAGMTLEQKAAIPSLDPARASAILGGAIVCAEATRAAGAESVTISERDILDGIALELAE